VPSLDSITFDTSALRYQSQRDQARIWHTPDGDRVGLYYFPLKPDIGASLQSLDAVRKFCRSAAAAAGAAIIEVETVPVDGCEALRQIVKVPQQPHGMTYLGSITLPFRDFSFVVKVQCPERGTTGMRDAVVLDESFGDGRVTVDRMSQSLRGWMQDPYDPALRDGFRRNLSEGMEYDACFPDHPLSRLRLMLAHLQRTIHVEDDVRRSPPFTARPPDF
jgi:hypothetical protein